MTDISPAIWRDAKLQSSVNGLAINRLISLKKKKTKKNNNNHENAFLEELLFELQYHPRPLHAHTRRLI